MKRKHLVDVRLEPNKEERAQICAFGDLHFGSKTCDMEKAQETLQRCIDKHIYVVGMGDMIEMATRYSVGAGVYEQKLTPQDQMEQIIDFMRPIAESGLLLGMHTGNHEQRAWQTTGINVMDWICRELKTSYLNHSAFHLWRVGKESYTAFSTHGSSGSRLAYTKLKSALDVFRYVQAELVLYGHLHGLDHLTSLYSCVDKRRKMVVELARHAILTGSYLGYKGSYAEKKNLPPVQMGSPIISLWGDEHKIHVSL